MDKLEFQDLPYEDKSEKTGGGAPSSSKATEHTVEFTDFPPDATTSAEDDDQDEQSQSRPSHSIFSLAFYQQYFDVDTFDVGNRIVSSMVPNPYRNYLEHVIRPSPDLYGPFWICATLTFSIAITGNVADFFAKSGIDFYWKYDFNKVPLAATAIFSYWLIIPFVVWLMLRWRGAQAGYTLTELICVYGYSLAIFIPLSILWLIPFVWLQILLTVLCSVLSGLTLVITLYPAVKNDSKQVMLIALFMVVVLHALLAVGFQMYFFPYEASDSSAHNLTNSTTAASSQQDQRAVASPSILSNTGTGNGSQVQT